MRNLIMLDPVLTVVICQNPAFVFCRPSLGPLVPKRIIQSRFGGSRRLIFYLCFSLPCSFYPPRISLWKILVLAITLHSSSRAPCARPLRDLIPSYFLQASLTRLQARIVFADPQSKARASATPFSRVAFGFDELPPASGPGTFAVSSI